MASGRRIWPADGKAAIVAELPFLTLVPLKCDHVSRGNTLHLRNNRNSTALGLYDARIIIILRNERYFRRARQGPFLTIAKIQRKKIATRKLARYSKARC